MSSTRVAALEERLRRDILDGTARPGERLPSEVALAERHGVSRTVVREAIARLRADGWVRSARGSGTYVLAVPRPDGPGAEAPGRPGTAPDPAELLEFRLALEPQAAALAARRRTTADLSRLDEALEAFAAAQRSPADSLDADFAFHRTIAETAGNGYLRRAVDELGPLMITMPTSRILGTREHVAVVDSEHRVIARAIAVGDAVTAAAAMRAHLSRGLQDVQEARAGRTGSSTE